MGPCHASFKKSFHLKNGKKGNWIFKFFVSFIYLFIFFDWWEKLIVHSLALFFLFVIFWFVTVFKSSNQGNYMYGKMPPLATEMQAEAGAQSLPPLFRRRKVRIETKTDPFSIFHSSISLGTEADRKTMPKHQIWVYVTSQKLFLLKSWCAVWSRGPSGAYGGARPLEALYSSRCCYLQIQILIGCQCS